MYDQVKGLRLSLVTVMIVGVGCAPAAGPNAESVSQRLASLYAGETTDFQRELLADLQVTREEYERAVFATLDCIRDRVPGLGVEGPFLRPNGVTMSYDLVSTTGNDPDALAEHDRLVALADSCSVEFLSNVEAVWLEQNIPTGSIRSEMRQAFIDCATGAGLTGLTNDMEYPEVLNAVAQYNNRAQDGRAYDCLYKYELAFTAPVDLGQ